MRAIVISHRNAPTEQLSQLLAPRHDLIGSLEVDDASELGDGHDSLASADAIVIAAKRCRQPLLDLISAARRGSDGRILVVCDRIGSSDARMLLFSGVLGLVLVDEASTTLLPTIEAIRVGQLCLPARHAGDARRPNLSQRERQVIGLVAMGLTNREIADRLFLVESTVKSHLTSAFQKLGVRSRSEAVDLIVDPAFGLSTGILSFGAQPITAARARP